MQHRRGHDSCALSSSARDPPIRHLLICRPVTDGRRLLICTSIALVRLLFCTPITLVRRLLICTPITLLRRLLACIRTVRRPLGARCKNLRRGSFILNPPSRASTSLDHLVGDGKDVRRNGE